MAALVTVTKSQSPEQQAALDAHNAARAEVGVTPLIWDNSLAAGAQDWANHLATLGHLEHSGTNGQGENIYGQGNGDNVLVNAVNSWVNEKPLYHGEPISETNYQLFGHYSKWCNLTQVISLMLNIL